jgi:biopolymer transport protein ExbD
MRSLRFRDTSQESTFDLNLAPMMDMLVSIIPFMLLSATFMQIMLIDVPLPTPVAQALQADRNNDKREVVIKVDMSQGGFSIAATDLNGKTSKKTIPKKDSEFNFEGLHKELVSLKQVYPKVFRLELNPEESIDYKTIVKAMDEARDMKNADPKILIENAPTPLLFPDVVLSNLMG